MGNAGRAVQPGWKCLSQGGACLEVAPSPHTIHVRDSKLGPRSPRFAVAGGAWAAFVAYARTGSLSFEGRGLYVRA
ncbi:DUF397 domain-containing protein [Streptomyces sp. NPDC001812]|uniref:DUF397 domain-containing protein n=1 Tax=Streptomyces cathayae TaxID=3031124 RepID=A0ABY8K156_9ACTN|nr:DUF397 domain-containing protein [Streptomyces sp. HUAS 5]WGD41249.1 DUF397 domain-containing protein [Streptomyces sp. HUAS 5]